MKENEPVSRRHMVETDLVSYIHSLLGQVQSLGDEYECLRAQLHPLIDTPSYEDRLNGQPDEGDISDRTPVPAMSLIDGLSHDIQTQIHRVRSLRESLSLSYNGNDSA